MKPRVLILRAPGANCDAEAEFAFNLAGGGANGSTSIGYERCRHFWRIIRSW